MHWFTAFTILALAPGTLFAQEQWRKIRGADIAPLFNNQEFGDGAHFAYRMRGDGTFSGTEMGKEVSGAWRVTGDEMCWSWLRPPGPRECYAVEQDGPQVRLMVNGSEAWFGTLRPLP